MTIDSVSGRILARTPIGVPDAAWSVVYTVATSGGRTTLRAIDPRTGGTRRQTTINGRYALASVVPDDLPTGLTGNGQSLVLVSAEPPPGHTQFALVDTTFAAPPQVVDLAGDFEFDAIGPDGHYLFLIEHIGARGSGHYQVRAFDLMVRSLLEGAIVDKREVDEQMNGRPVARTASGTGRTVSTLYVKEDGEAFVHQLDTVDGFAFCIDLPDDLRASTSEQANAWRIVSSGDRAYVANPRLGAALSIFEGNVLAAGDIPISTGTEPVEAALDSRGENMYVGDSNGLTVVITSRMRAAGPALPGVGSGGVAVASAGRLFALDAAGSAVVELSTARPAPTSIRRVELPKLGGGSSGSLRLIGLIGG